MKTAVHPAFKPRRNEIYAHTSLRGVASLCVVAYHAALFFRPRDANGFVYDFLGNSFFFVDMFFILSGFIMVESYGARLRKRVDGGVLDGRAVVEFWWRRLLKILPNYYAALGLGLVIAVVINLLRNDPFPAQCLAESLTAYVMLVQELGGGVCYNINQPLWSIVTELIAYIGFPVLVLLLGSPIFMLLLVVCLYGLLFTLSQEAGPIAGFPSVVRTFGGFVLGMWLAQVHMRVPSSLKTMLQLPAFLGVVLAVAWGVNTAVILACALLVLVTAADTGVLTRLSQHAWLYRLGRISFSMYLVHIPLLIFFHLVLSKIEVDTGLSFTSIPGLTIPVGIGIGLAAGFVNYLWIEWPIERVAKKRRGPLQSGAGT